MAHPAERSLKERGNILLTGLLIILVIGVVVLVGVGIKRRHDREKTAAAVTPVAATAATPAAPAATLSTGTDNQTLDDDLTNIGTSLTLNGQSLSSANTAVNDQQSQITVPTN